MWSILFSSGHNFTLREMASESEGKEKWLGLEKIWKRKGFGKTASSKHLKHKKKHWIS